jgi:hypothetical protein
LWQDRVRLDEGFGRSLREHLVPVRKEAVKTIKALRHFKPIFLEAFPLAAAVYPEARVEVDSEHTGVVLRPSPPAVPKPVSRANIALVG